ncbi:hypothetical protein A0J61_04673 [Choanephora cucurbitarum]|uniref:Uncharacterized protein n=1 Tax=Choanephora cucurbitarum TaxID=101091 RepID=A0A1C7NDZ3_9FUNG|nr:hypothetical protein A0J61_04673 [Choanephora cucurbitarum]
MNISSISKTRATELKKEQYKGQMKIQSLETELEKRCMQMDMKGLKWVWTSMRVGCLMTVIEELLVFVLEVRKEAVCS